MQKAHAYKPHRLPPRGTTTVFKPVPWSNLMWLILGDLLYNLKNVSDLCLKKIVFLVLNYVIHMQGLYILRYRNNLDKVCYQTRFVCFADDITDILLTFAILLRAIKSKMLSNVNKKIKLYSSLLSIINIVWFWEVYIL